MAIKSDDSISFKPNYEKPCINCDQNPTVDIFDDKGDLLDNSELCGPCFFGRAECVEVENW